MMVKICGITNREDALAAVEFGASAIGLNFYRYSPRYVSHTGAAMITEGLPENILKVGVFVDEAAEPVAKIGLQVGLDVAQLHGSAECETLPVWRAVPVADESDVRMLSEARAEAILLDAHSPELFGGTGRTFPWELARQAGRVSAKHIILAGGLDDLNVAKAIAAAQPWGVDACSRLESAPGRKDHAKMKKFIEAALAAEI